MEHNRVIYSKAYDSEIEYLESTGTQWIDSGVCGNENTNTSIKFQIVTFNNGAQGVLGARAHYQDYGFGFTWNSNFNNTLFFQLFNGENSQYQLNTTALEVRNDKGKLYVNNELVFTHSSSPSFITPSSIRLFIMKDNSVNYYSKSRIYYCQLWDNGVLVRDFIPVRKGSIGYLYDKVSRKLFANKGTGNFILGQDVSNPVHNIRRVFRFDNKRFVMPMPYDSKIEYLESSGNQYIDTGHILNGNDKVDIVYDRLGYGIIFGSRSSYNTKECSITNESGNNHKYYIKFGITGQQQILYESNTQPTGTVSVHIESGDIKVNGTTVSTALYGSNFFNGNCFLFLINQNGSAYSGTQKFPKRIRSFKIEGILDLIPVRRGNVGYMYDKVSGKLFGNAGTGQFILGNDIN